MVESSEIAIAGLRYGIVSDDLLPSGKRAITRMFRATNDTDPAKMVRREWDVSGPTGNSLLSFSRVLAVNYCQNLETRWPRRLISAGKRVSVDLTGVSPGGGLPTYGSFNYGDPLRPYGGLLAVTAQQTMLSYGPNAGWGLANATGDMLDIVGSLDGVVTLGSGARDTTPLDNGGDGSMTFDGTASEVTIPDGAAIQNIFDGGGFFSILVQPDTVVGSPVIAGKAASPGATGWFVGRSTTRIAFNQRFTGTDGVWATDLGTLTAGITTYVGIAYDASSTVNNPTIYVWDATNGLRTLTVGDGVTQFSAPTGIRESDVGEDLDIGHLDSSLFFDGVIDEPFAFNSSQPSLAQIETYVEQATALNAQETMLSYTPSAGWGLGEVSGDALDLVGSNDGAVTIGAGARDTSPLDIDGDGSITFDGTATNITVPDATALQDIWDGGGFASVIVQPDAAVNRALIAKAASALDGWYMSTGGGLEGPTLTFIQTFSGTDGRWDAASAFVAGRTTFVGIAYDASSAANAPTVYLWDRTNGLRVLTVGDGLTQNSTPTGTRDSDVGDDFYIGHLDGNSDFDGVIDEVFLFNGSQPTADEIEAYVERVATGGGGGFVVNPPEGGSEDITAFDEQGGAMFAHGGRQSTQVRISDWTAVETVDHGTVIRDAESWFGEGRVSLGGTAPVQTRSGVGSTSSVYEDTEDGGGSPVFASSMATGSNRLWYVVGDASGTNENKVTFTLNDFDSSASPFVVGDQRISATGIGPFGVYTFFGSLNGLYSFTDQGLPRQLSRALVGMLSGLNGAQWADPGFGWNYATSVIGLRAVVVGVDNPVGIGEGMRGFTGHGGIPTALFSARGELWVAYQTEDGDTYIYRCAFGPETSNGQPELYPFRYLPDTDVRAIFSTATPANPAVVWAEDASMSYMTIAADGRDDLLTAYDYGTSGGTWFGTTYDLEPHLKKTLRLSRLRTKGMETGDSWTLAWSFDDGAYVSMPVVTADGYHTVRPVSSSMPMASISGRTLAPRLVQVAGGASSEETPPEVNGTLEAEWDERPDNIEVVSVMVLLGQDGRTATKDWQTLRTLVGSNTDGPSKIRLPGALADQYAMVADVTERRDLKGDGIEAATVVLHVWDVS